MEVINPRAALLSNYEVLTLLRELESDHLSRAKTAIRVRKEEEAAGHPPHLDGLGETSENLRTVEVEAIQYLSADYLPTQKQSPERITQLVQSLASYELTKAEKLQIVNLAPTLPVELYVIVEELEDRLGEKMDEILAHVRSILAPSVSTKSTHTEATSVMNRHSDEFSNLQRELVYTEDNDLYDDENIFDDTGEGAGVEGDLDMEDD